MRQQLQSKAPFILVAAIAFFVYELYLLLNSNRALLEIYQAVSLSVDRNGFTTVPVLWLFSELTNEAGLVIRFAGSLFFLAFAVLLARKRLSLALFRRGVLLEGIQYLFIVPFLSLWLFFPSSIRSYEAAVSYILQIALITPSFILLYRHLKQPQDSSVKVLKVGAVAAVCFLFAMSAKHFFFGLYALPINFNNPILAIGFVNSTVTILISALILLLAFLPILRGKKGTFNTRIVGVALLLVGVYSAIFILISMVNGAYLSFLTLTELWLISLIAVGLGFILMKAA